MSSDLNGSSADVDFAVALMATERNGALDDQELAPLKTRKRVPVTADGMLKLRYKSDQG
jgi:hypothetical protein